MSKPEIMVVGYGWASIGFIQDIDLNIVMVDKLDI